MIRVEGNVPGVAYEHDPASECRRDFLAGKVCFRTVLRRNHIKEILHESSIIHGDFVDCVGISCRANAATESRGPGKYQARGKADAKPDAKTGAAATPGSPALAEMKTTNFKGVLVDMACASRSSSSAETKPASAETKPANAEAKPAASDTGGSCAVSASSSEIGMKLDDGKTVRFDLVGNQRAQDLLKNDKRWSKDISANKPIHAKVSGVLNGDKLIVAAIH